MQQQTASMAFLWALWPTHSHHGANPAIGNGPSLVVRVGLDSPGTSMENQVCHQQSRTNFVRKKREEAHVKIHYIHWSRNLVNESILSSSPAWLPGSNFYTKHFENTSDLEHNKKFSMLGSKTVPVLLMIWSPWRDNGKTHHWRLKDCRLNLEAAPNISIKSPAIRENKRPSL